MIDAIKEIGKYALEKEGKSIDNPLDILIDNPANRDTEYALFILLEGNGGRFKYRGIEPEPYSRDKLKKYLYKKGPSAGTDITPTAMVTTIEGTFNRKILGWFNEYDTLGSDNKINFLVKIGKSLRENKEKILEDLKEKYDKKSNIISLKINGKYIGDEDYEIFRSILVDTAKKNFYFTKSFPGDNKQSKSENKICSVCNQEQAEVYGFVNTFKFYTVDKKGFVSGGFRQKYAWKNYPVCLNCALTLEEGRKYLGAPDKLNFNFYGFKYLLIPKFLTKLDESIKKRIFKRMERQRDPKLGKEGKPISSFQRITDDESGMLDLMSKQKNYMNINFMFYEAPKGYDGAVFNILIYIEDILPSRLKTLFDAKTGNKEKNIKGVDQMDIFKECMVPVFENRKKTGEKPLEFNFGVLITFFPKVSNNRTYDRYFLDIVNKIFTNKPIDPDFLMNFIVRKIRDDFINGYPTKISTLKGFMLLNYQNNLKRLEKKGGDKMNVDESNESEEYAGGENEIDKKINSFFNEFNEFFDCNAKKAVFLEGVLTQFLLNIQYARRGSTPFLSKLKGLNLDRKHLTEKLLKDIKQKLWEYESYTYKGVNLYDLQVSISNHLVSAGDNWKMSNDEISFYFVLGMNLADRFKLKNKKEDNDEGDKNE